VTANVLLKSDNFTCSSTIYTSLKESDPNIRIISIVLLLLVGFFMSINALSQTDTSLKITPINNPSSSEKVSGNKNSMIYRKSLAIPDQIDYKYDTVCLGDTTHLIKLPDSNDSILNVEWDLNMNGKYTDAKGDTVEYVFTQAGIHPVVMRVNFLSGAFKIIIHQVPVGDSPSIQFSYTGVCSPNTSTNFTDSSKVMLGTIKSWLWNYGDGKSELDSNIYTYHNYHAGNYTVKLTVTSSLGCVDSLTKPIIIYENPNILLRREDNSQVYFDDTVTFKQGDSAYLKVDQPATYDSIVWPGNAHGEVYYLKESGHFEVTAYTNVCPGFTDFYGAQQDTSGGGGTAITSTDIMRVFTPNGDGYNDYFVIDSPDITQPVSLSIYNRAGSIVYESSGYNNDWKGEYRGNPLPTGTYYYVIKDAKGKKVTGAISILR